MATVVKRRRRVRVVPDWRRGWRWISVWMAGLPASAAGAWVLAPKEWRDAVPPEWLLTIICVLCVIGGVGRFIQQGVRDDGDDQPEGSGDATGA